MKQSIFGLILILFNACAPRVTTNLTKTYPALAYDEEVAVIGITEDAPPSAIEVGIVKIGDTGFSTNCKWEVVIEKAKLEARKSGGNIVKITQHIPPSILGSSCDRITAKILKVENAGEIIKWKDNNRATVDSTWEYAKLFIYRPKGTGVLLAYDLYFGDSVICRVGSDSKQEIRLTQKGANKIWARTEAKTEIPINIQFGKEYYLKCGVGMGIMVGRPQLQLVNKAKGRLEYNLIKDSK